MDVLYCVHNETSNINNWEISVQRKSFKTNNFKLIDSLVLCYDSESSTTFCSEIFHHFCVLCRRITEPEINQYFTNQIVFAVGSFGHCSPRNLEIKT